DDNEVAWRDAAAAHPAAPDSEHAEPDHRAGLAFGRLCDPRRGDTVLLGTGRAAPYAGLGADDQLGRFISDQRSLACDRARDGYLHNRLQLQPSRRLAPRCARPKAALLIASRRNVRSGTSGSATLTHWRSSGGGRILADCLEVAGL